MLSWLLWPAMAQSPPARKLSSPAATPAVRRGETPTVSRGETHTVRRGETPYAIARKHGLTVEQLLKANRLAAGATIQPGQKLIVSKAGSRSPAAAPAAAGGVGGKEGLGASGWGRYTVKSGETVRALAARFGLSQKELMRLNGLKDPTKLRAGAVVKYPVAAAISEEAEEGGAEAGEEVPAVSPEDFLPTDWQWHAVQRGESLSQIAARYGHDRRSLEQVNALPSGAFIHEGLRLKIPPPGALVAPAERVVAQRPAEGADHSVLAYTVQKEDTVDSLAETFATTPAILRKLNRLAPEEPLLFGSRIVVPNNLFE
jgi:membrane-bound lytic murein transglycosylase D